MFNTIAEAVDYSWQAHSMWAPFIVAVERFVGVLLKRNCNVYRQLACQLCHKSRCAQCKLVWIVCIYSARMVEWFVVGPQMISQYIYILPHTTLHAVINYQLLDISTLQVISLQNTCIPTKLLLIALIINIGQYTDNFHFELNPLKIEFLLNNIYKFSLYLTENTLPLCYKYQLVNAI
jgi:hypothetical protein